jgi:hypothetical protein
MCRRFLDSDFVVVVAVAAAGFGYCSDDTSVHNFVVVMVDDRFDAAVTGRYCNTIDVDQVEVVEVEVAVVYGQYSSCLCILLAQE